MAQLIYGKNVVKTKLESHSKIEKLYLVAHDSYLEKLAQKNNIAIEYISKGKANSLANGGNHQNVLALIQDYTYISLQQLIDNNKDNKYSTLVITDGLQDPHNLGAILRTCDGCGFNGVIIKENNNVEINSTVAKVSVGAIDTIPVCKVVNINNTIKTLKDNGYWVVGTIIDSDTIDYRLPDYKQKIVVILGNEGKGISKLVSSQADWKVMIPMHGVVDSLNVSCAFAVLGYEILNQRFPK